MSDLLKSCELSYASLQDGWRYEMHNLDIEGQLLGDLRSFLDVYRGKLKAGSLPSWKDFDFYDFVGWHGRVSLLKVVDRNPYDFYVRLFGTVIAEYYEEDWTGKNLRRGVDTKPVLYEEDFRFYEEIAKGNYIGIAYGDGTWLDKDFNHFTLLSLPLADDHENCSHILNAIISSHADHIFQDSA